MNDLNKITAINMVDSFMGRSIVEASLGRVAQYLKNREWFIISVNIPDMPKETEYKQGMKFVRELRSNALGYIPLRCKYTKDEKSIEYESGFFVVNVKNNPNFKEWAKDYCKKYEQPAVLYCNNGEAAFLNGDGEEVGVGKDVEEVEELNVLWSRLMKDKKSFTCFAFESLYPTSNFGLNAAHNRGELF